MQPEQREQAKPFSTLSEQSNRLKAMFETVVDGIITIDQTGLIESFNPSAEKLFGYTAADVVGKNVTVLMDEPHRSLHDGYLQRYLNTGERKVIGIGREVMGRRKDGSLFQLELSVSEMEVNGRRMFTGVIRDISEQTGRMRLLDAITAAQQEASLKLESNKIFEKLLDELLTLTQSEYGFIGEVLFDKASEPYLKTHAITNIAWNEETRRFYDENAPSGLEFRNLDTLFGKVLTGRETIISNNPFMDPRSGGLPEGHPSLNSFLGLPFFAQEELIGMVGIANRPGGFSNELVDFLRPFLLTCSTLIVTQRSENARKEAEVTLRESEARGRAILQGASEAIVTVDEQGNIEDINPATERIFGYNLEELKGVNVKLLMPEPFNSEHDDYIRRYLETRIPKIIGTGREVFGKRKDGSVFPMELSVNHITVGGRNIFTGVIRDISEQKNSAFELKRLNDNLSTRVKELDSLNETNQILNEMSSYFQSAESLDELNRILVKYCSPLFNLEAGAFFQLTEKNLLECAATWGEPFDGLRDFKANECWALRRGDSKIVYSSNEVLSCQHLQNLELTHSICVPVTTREGAVGLLSIYSTREHCDEDEFGAERIDRHYKLLSSIGDRLGTAISNIKLRETLRIESIHDPLTKLYNRRFFEESVELEFRRSRRSNRPLSILIIDADHFKRFNDDFGHEAGDLVLQSLAGVIRSNTRKEDIPCRYGGEEFAIMLSNADKKLAAARAEEIRMIVESTKLNYKGTALPRITVSCGVASIPEDAKDQFECFTLADKALYKAKHGGRNTVMVTN